MRIPRSVSWALVVSIAACFLAPAAAQQYTFPFSAPAAGSSAAPTGTPQPPPITYQPAYRPPVAPVGWVAPPPVMLVQTPAGEYILVPCVPAPAPAKKPDREAPPTVLLAQGAAPATPQTPQTPQAPEGRRPTTPETPRTPTQQNQPQDQQQSNQDNQDNQQNNQDNQAPEGGTSAAPSATPGVYGDFFQLPLGFVVPNPNNGASKGSGTSSVAPNGLLPSPPLNPKGPPPAQPKTAPVMVFPGNAYASAAAAAVTQVPLVARVAIKISENESPEPVDRVFATYHYFNNLNPTVRPAGLGQLDFHRELMGFEKRVFDEDTSIGMRLPFYELVGDDRVKQYDISDLTFIVKNVFYRDPYSGSLISRGLVVTAPTGHNPTGPGDVRLNPTVLQPYLGYLVNFGDVYMQGFSSVAVPVDARDTTLVFNDIQFGWRAIKPRRQQAGQSDAPQPPRFLSGLVPIFEVHVDDPLDHRGLLHAPGGLQDAVILTVGTTFIFRDKCFVNVGAAMPVTGEEPFEVEGQIQVNWRY